MAGRGRGRGKGFTFDVSQIGFQKGEALPAAIQQPPPLFPPLRFKPVPLASTDTDEYLIALKQEFRGIMQESEYFIKPDVVKKDIQRYSDKYKELRLDTLEWKPDWSRMPEELKEKPKRKALSNKKPNLASSKKAKVGQVDVTNQLDKLEKNERGSEEDDEEEGEKEGEEEQEYDEEEQEEDNDYLVSHYDDGEEIGFEDNDDNDEPTYY